jgi:hypothetical protein
MASNVRNEIRRVERVTVTKITFVRGSGSEGDPVREVVAWWTDDNHNRQLVEEDPVGDRAARNLGTS